MRNMGRIWDGRLFLKEDSHLAIAGSVKARGGIYEVLNYTEKLAREHGFLGEDESYEKLGDEEVRRFLNGLYHSGGFHRQPGP